MKFNKLYNLIEGIFEPASPEEHKNRIKNLFLSDNDEAKADTIFSMIDKMPYGDVVYIDNLNETLEQGEFDFNTSTKKRKLSMDSGYETYYPSETFSNAFYLVKNFYSSDIDGSNEMKIPMIIDKKIKTAIEAMVSSRTPIGKIYGFVLKHNYNDDFKMNEEIFEPATPEEIQTRRINRIKTEGGLEEIIWGIVNEQDIITIENVNVDEKNKKISVVFGLTNWPENIPRSRIDEFIQKCADHIEDELEECKVLIIKQEITPDKILNLFYEIDNNEI
jgi:hypothetical protein